jgi:hypothetical protein
MSKKDAVFSFHLLVPVFTDMALIAMLVYLKYLFTHIWEILFML